MRDWRERLGAWVRDPVAWGAAAAFLVAHTVYMMTLTISSPFWDSGEFIMASYTLGVPHPPGTPLYVLIGRLFSLAPLSQISARVNYMSALAASLAVLFSYLIIVDLARRWARGRETPLDRWLAVAGGLAGAFFMAFGRTFWDNAIEAEVYALSSLIMVFAVWLMLRWEASGPSNRRDPRYLILIVYLLFVGVGAHMGVLLVAPALFLYLLLVSPGTFFNRDVLAGTALVAAGVLLFALLRSAGTGFSAALLITLGAYGGTLAWRWSRLGARNLATWALAFAVLGLSVHFYLILRARLAPTLNLADPSNWENLWLVLSRDQYKPANPFEVRQASWAIQFTKHFWRYWQDQFDLGVRPQWFAQALPYLIGFLGAGTQALRDRRRFLLLLTLVFFCSVFLVFYLNFRADEVRDRDYFFVSGYHFFALWIGLGVVAVGRWLRGDPAAAAGAGGPPARAEGVAAARAGEGAPAGGVQVGAGAGGERPAARGAPWPAGARIFSLGGAGVLVLLSLFPMRAGWYEHDRTDFYVARDYAYNLLTPLAPDAVVFTNGDNDTYPLWYIQYVEGIRPDVRVVNLSLLNTAWYIRQVRDYPPRVRITVPDRELDGLHGVILPSGKVVLVKDMMVHHILEQNPERAIYIAVTVPELMELDNRLVMEGLVYRVEAEEGAPHRTDVEKTLRNLREVYLYTGLLDEQGHYDKRVYKDSTARKLVQNYVVAYIEVAKTALQDGRSELALEALEAARRINPDFPAVLYTLGYLLMQRGDYARAEEVFRGMLDAGNASAEVHELLGAALEAQRRGDEAEGIYRQALSRHPQNFDMHRILFTLLWNQGRKQDAVDLIEDWLRRNPEDQTTRAALRQLQADDSAGTAPQPSAPRAGERGAAAGAAAGERGPAEGPAAGEPLPAEAP